MGLCPGNHSHYHMSAACFSTPPSPLRGLPFGVDGRCLRRDRHVSTFECLSHYQVSLTAALLLQNLSIYHVKPYLLLWSCRISVPSPHAYMKHIRTVCLCMTVRPRPVCFVFPTSTIYLPAFTLLRAASRCFAPPFDLGAYFLAHAVDRLYYSYSAT